MITFPGHASPPPSGVATVTPWTGLSRRGPASAGPVYVQEPKRADARLRPERPMGGAGARPSEAAEGLKIPKFGN